MSNVRTVNVKSSWFPNGNIFFNHRKVFNTSIFILHKYPGSLWVDIIRLDYPSGFINIE